MRMLTQKNAAIASPEILEKGTCPPRVKMNKNKGRPSPKIKPTTNRTRPPRTALLKVIVLAISILLQVGLYRVRVTVRGSTKGTQLLGGRGDEPPETLLADPTIFTTNRDSPVKCSRRLGSALVISLFSPDQLCHYWQMV